MTVDWAGAYAQLSLCVVERVVELLGLVLTQSLLRLSYCLLELNIALAEGSAHILPRCISSRAVRVATCDRADSCDAHERASLLVPRQLRNIKRAQHFHRRTTEKRCHLLDASCVKGLQQWS